MNNFDDYDHNGNYKGSSWYPNEGGIDAEYERQCAIDDWEHRPLSEKISDQIWLLKEKIIDLFFNTEFKINLTVSKKQVIPF
tara:strand:+ start:736 stop:981 length:246 start_codon:yes stop_codon:yes gene_type:complete